MADLLTVTAKDLENGVAAQASTDGTTVSVLAVNHKWRTERTTDLVITLPASVDPDATVTYYLIDTTHSNRYDVGSGTGTLEAVSPPTIIAGAVTITMQPRSVHLLQFGPPGPPPAVPGGEWGIPIG